MYQWQFVLISGFSLIAVLDRIQYCVTPYWRSWKIVKFLLIVNTRETKVYWTKRKVILMRTWGLYLWSMVVGRRVLFLRIRFDIYSSGIIISIDWEDTVTQDLGFSYVIVKRIIQSWWQLLWSSINSTHNYKKPINQLTNRECIL